MYVNPERITYIEAKRQDKVVIQFQTEVNAGGLGIPPSFLVVKGRDAEELLRWLERNADKVGMA